MRLIDAGKAKVLLDWTLIGDAADAACRVIDSAPTVDAVVVTRCKDCEHYDMGVCLKIYSDGNVHPEAWQSRKPEDFCSYGERKDGGGSDEAD